MNFTIQQREVGEVDVLLLQGYLTGERETDVLENKVREILEGGGTKVVVNLAEVQHINPSHGFAALITMCWKYQGDVAIKFCCDTPGIVALFTNTQMTDLLSPTEEEAIASFAEPKQV